MLDMTQLRQYGAKLSAAPARAAGPARMATAKVTQDVASTAKVRAPVDTGALRSSITGRITEASASRIVGEVTPGVHYAIYQELGTSRMAPQPFLFPALDHHGPQLGDAVAQIVEGALGG